MTHEHEIKDSDFSFLINLNDRGIYKQSPGKIALIQGDHDSERFSFRIPRYIEGHDTSVCDKIYVHYNNIAANKIDQSKDVYLVKDMKVDPADEDYVIFSWLISGNATMYAGILSFLIEFLCLDGEKITYSWHTGTYNTSVSEGMNNSEAVTEEFSDVLAAWEAEAIKNVTDKALEAANEIFGNELDTLKQSDEDNANALQELRTEYEEALAELQKADEDNATAIQELTEAYNAKVAELEATDAENKKAIEDHIEAYNKKVIELEGHAHNASLAASNAQSLANNALNAANNAQTSANEAQATANNAVEAANNAQDTANNALGIVNEAHDKAVEAQNTIDEHKVAYDAKVAELEKADETNATNLEDHVEAYNKKVAELEAADTTNAENLEEHKTTYNAKVEELEAADKANSDALETHKTAYNEKVAALEEKDEELAKSFVPLNKGTTNYTRVYAIDKKNQITMIDVSPNYTDGDMLPRRDSEGHIKAPATQKTGDYYVSEKHVANNYAKITSLEEEIARAKAAEKANSDAIELLTNGVSESEVDSVKDLVDYVNEHGAEVTQMQNDISSNAKAIEENAKALEDYKSAFNLENGAGENSIQLKGGNAQGNNSVDFSESVQTMKMGEPYTNAYLQANFSNDLSDEEKQRLFPVKRVQLKNWIDGCDVDDEIVITFGDGSYLKPKDYGYEFVYYGANGERLIAFGDDPSDDTENDFVDVNTYIKSIHFYFAETLLGDSYVSKGIFDYFINIYGAEVIKTGALADYTFTAGKGTQATVEGQTALGTFNEVDDDALLMIGNGTEESPSNALVVKKNGDVYAGNKADKKLAFSGELGLLKWRIPDDMGVLCAGNSELIISFVTISSEYEVECRYCHLNRIPGEHEYDSVTYPSKHIGHCTYRDMGNNNALVHAYVELYTDWTTGEYKLIVLSDAASSWDEIIDLTQYNVSISISAVKS